MKKLILLSLLICGISYAMDEKSQEWIKKEQEWLKIGREHLEIERAKLEAEKERNSIAALSVALQVLNLHSAKDDIDRCAACGSTNRGERKYPYSGSGDKEKINISYVTCIDCGKLEYGDPLRTLKKSAAVLILNHTFKSDKK